MNKLLALFGGGSWFLWVGAALLAVIGVQQVRIISLKADVATEQRDRKDERLRRAESALVEVGKAKAEGERRVAAIQGVLDATQPKLDAARAAADLLPDLDRRVRVATAALRACRAAAPSDSAPAQRSTPAEETERVLAELQRSAQAAEAERARFADEAAAAGERCASIYDSLKPGPAVTGAE